jgi:hypothetical protein
MNAAADSSSGDRAARLIHLVPVLPPPFEGVGGYAQELGGALAERFGCLSTFLIGDPDWRRGAETGTAVALALPAREATALRCQLEQETEVSTVLLHYANYGFDPHGCPDWLIAGLEGWRRGAPQRRLITFFHEVYASGPPWRRSFWQGRHQRRLAERLARASDHLVTSLPIYRDLLAPWTSGREVEMLPVPSTVGETADPLPFGSRRKRLAVFGSAGIRRRAYGAYRDELIATCQALEVEEVCDIGAAIGAPQHLGSIPVHALGPLLAAEIQTVLSSTRAGFLAYPPAFLPKSTIFAAYVACGVLPVCAWRGESPDSRLAAGRHYWAPGGRRPTLGEIETIRDEAGTWYRGHDLAHQAAAFDRLLRRPETPA